MALAGGGTAGGPAHGGGCPLPACWAEAVAARPTEPAGESIVKHANTTSVSDFPRVRSVVLPLGPYGLPRAPTGFWWAAYQTRWPPATGPARSDRAHPGHKHVNLAMDRVLHRAWVTACRRFETAHAAFFCGVSMRPTSTVLAACLPASSQAADDQAQIDRLDTIPG